MANRETIKHAGVIRAINGATAEVEIESSSACTACKARSMCNASESKVKMISAQIAAGEAFELGQQVEVVGEERMGLVAVLLAYVLPLLLMLSILIVAKRVGASDAQGGLAALGALIPYYIVIYLLRRELNKKIIFTIEQKNQNN